MLACGVDIAPPPSLDKEQSMDPVEEVKFQFLEWIAERWCAGVRCKTYKGHFRSSDMAQEVGVESEQENWITLLSKNRLGSVELRMGKALSLVKNFPFETKNGVFRLVSRVADKRNIYYLEKIK